MPGRHQYHSLPLSLMIRHKHCICFWETNMNGHFRSSSVATRSKSNCWTNNCRIATERELKVAFPQHSRRHILCTQLLVVQEVLHRLAVLATPACRNEWRSNKTPRTHYLRRPWTRAGSKRGATDHKQRGDVTTLTYGLVITDVATEKWTQDCP